jgi:hypothetical protein
MPEIGWNINKNFSLIVLQVGHPRSVMGRFGELGGLPDS